MSTKKEDAREGIIAQTGMRNVIFQNISSFFLVSHKNFSSLLNGFLLLSASPFLIYQKQAFSSLVEIVSQNHLGFG